MSDRRLSTPNMALIGVRALAGATLLLTPRRVLEALPERRTDPTARNVARVLGGRDLIEAGLLWHRPTRGRILIGAGVDITHAATMLAIALARPEKRALPLTSALGAIVLAGAGVPAAVQTGTCR
jgi:hypothetical protein